MRCWPVAVFVGSLACVLSAARAAAGPAPAAAEVIPHRQDRPPNQPYTPQEALARMTVPPGFHVDLVAGEPDLVNPIAMTFDDRGRIWVTESIEYPRKPAGPGRDRVKVLEDTDGDGRADRVGIFAEGLNIPTGVAVGYGGVWLLNAPDLLFLREGPDGKEVSREVVLTGFGRADSHELPSSLTWGPDGWLYGLNGVFNPSRVRSPADGKVYDFTCAMWRVHPRTRQFQVFAEGTSNPYGIAWDRDGGAIVEACHWANDHLFHFVETGYYQRQAGAYPPFAMPVGSITDHGHQKTAYCGIASLDTGTFPPQYDGRIVVGNIHGGCLNVDRLERDGSTYVAKGEPDLLTANDVWFMPVSLKVGPDGCLYVLDWYDRYHCSQDAARDPVGVDRLKGRLYRLRYGEVPSHPAPDLAGESDQQLIGRLASPNGYLRETAQRLLTERLSAQPGRTPEPLRQALESLVMADAAPRAARIHATWALVGAGPLDAAFHGRLFEHPDAAFRAWAVRAAGNAGRCGPALRDAVARLARDPSPDVQLQVAIASRKVEGVDALAVLVDALARCGQDKLIPPIAWNNLHPLLESDGARFASVLEQINDAQPLPPGVATLLPRAIDRLLSAAPPNVEAAAALLDQAARRAPDRAAACAAAVSAKLDAMDAAARGRLAERLRPLVERVLGNGEQPDAAAAAAAAARLSVELLAARLGLARVDPAALRRRFVSAEVAESDRLQALEALVAFRDAPLLDALPDVLSSATPTFAARVLAALGRVEAPKLADMLLARYATLSPDVQPLAIDLLMQREPWSRKLLDAVLAGKVPKGVLNANHLRKILDSNDREAIWAVERAFGRVREERNPERERVVREMGEYLRGNLGDPVAGRQVFRNLCGQCHTIHGEGTASVGPDLTANGRASFDQLVSNVFDPSLVIGPAYQVTTVVTRDGRNLSGIVAEDGAQRVVLRLPGGGTEAVARNNVKYARVSKLSMMPEGIESLLSRRELADLFAFLSLDHPPGDPEAKPIPGAPAPKASQPAPAVGAADGNARIKLEGGDRSLTVRARLPGRAEWFDLATYVTEPKSRPYFHPLRDPTGRVVLTQDRPADHPWQHGVFTGFHQVNGFNYWKEDQGRQRLVRLLDLGESPDRVSWRALVELVAPDGTVVLEEEDAVTVHAPESPDACVIDFKLLLRAKGRDVTFGKFFVGGLSVRIPWDPAQPNRQTHLNSEGLRGRACEQQRAAWCTVEQPFGGGEGGAAVAETFGVAVFDHPDNANHPPRWRVDEQGLINPNVSGLADWSIPAGAERRFRYRLLVYRGPAAREQLARRFEEFAKSGVDGAQTR